MDLREIPAAAFERHPWERARARFFEACLERAGLLGRPLQVLDVGAGDGFLAAELARRLPAGSRVVCADTNYTDEHLARLEQTYGGSALSFVRDLPAGRFDLVMLLDVIEHVPQDARFLADLVASHVQQGGHVLVTVPAWMGLFTRHDVGVAHYRRYRPSQLAGVIGAAGLELRAAGGLFHSLLMPRAAQKLTELARGIRSVPTPDTAPSQANSDIAAWSQGKIVTRAVDLALAADNALSGLCARLRLPLPGLSTWALAQKG